MKAHLLILLLTVQFHRVITTGIGSDYKIDEATDCEMSIPGVECGNGAFDGGGEQNDGNSSNNNTNDNNNESSENKSKLPNMDENKKGSEEDMN